MKSVSVIIPVYNEANTIAKVLEAVLSCQLDEATITEVIVVDDASTDTTAQVVKEYKDVRLIYKCQNINQGKGSALRLGFTYVKGDIVIIQDGDLEYDPSEYQKLCDPIIKGSARVVYGSRFLKKRSWVSHMMVWRLANYSLTVFSNFFTGLHLTDMETCYKVFDRQVLDSFKDKLVSKRFEIEPELTAWVARVKAQIIEVPISYYARSYEHGKKIGWRDGVAALISIIRFSRL